MRSRALLAGCVVSAVLLVGGPAQAATTAVSIQNFGFSPAAVTVLQGGTVTWTQLDAGVEHTVTSNQGFWSSAELSDNQHYSAIFRNAGSYPYHCAIHTDMTGTVRVPINASGSASAGWTLRWSSLASTPASRAFDVQIRRPGTTTWSAWRTDTTVRAAFFHPRKTGTYAFRARTRNLSTGQQSGWSPVRQVRIS